MSMRAPLPSGSPSPAAEATALGRETRFERAKSGAYELLGSSREGDAVALVLAGSPPRVALAATSDLGAARVALAAITPSDRATDLEGAVAIARALVAQLPQVDKRVVLLSDLADGHADGPPLGSEGDIPLWVPLGELRGEAGDCGVLAADRGADSVHVTVACGHGATASGREVTLRAGGNVVGRIAAPPGAGGDVKIALP